MCISKKCKGVLQKDLNIVFVQASAKECPPFERNISISQLKHSTFKMSNYKKNAKNVPDVTIRIVPRSNLIRKHIFPINGVKSRETGPITASNAYCI